jgi:hypothetical protein
MREQYSAPLETRLGSVHERTLQNYNKIGGATDAASYVIPGLVGSITPVP